ncbi:iron-sulfur cluster carrier protein ApbC [Marinobacterium sediminicola]|uniref:Iron-sulfur cluster carrier protein n=1 Tax=Marinobacterium sediminicola TaxID=518898 RepID=A0ABY1RVX1_9GAMM|nr:iron-sulfur cluster carrier protein ApbC [Marinobacterium sediminicola]ULG70516.1 iron-sulfur cluster carrier protein ApbC [Marinobacterium sediminicola]SMR69119.1 ATP-binding protein involved in chromosome partitioning [Marinobacterium sediminicola]
MTAITRGQIEAAIETYIDPDLKSAFTAAGCVQEIKIDNDQVHIELKLKHVCATRHETIRSALTEVIAPVAGSRRIDVHIDQAVEGHPSPKKLPGLAGVKNIIAVASGKGGVGKSTTTVNLALALAAEGARVGILDADIYGPSQGMMLGVAEGERPDTAEEKYFKPIVRHGLQSMSMSYLVDENTPMVWRGPMVSGAMQQLLNQTLWQDLDYLLIDMPPGTGDIQLTLAQRVPVSAAVIVTTPQDIALLDARKGIEMFRKVDIPVLGVVENMSVHICSNCGHEEALFGAGGGERIAQQYETELLGQLPLALAIREQTDAGQPTVVADPDSAHAQRYKAIARRLSAVLAKKSSQGGNFVPNIAVELD